jgi:hypothetical protein
MALKLGVNCKLYRLSTGTRATWGTVSADGLHEGAAPSNLDEVPNVKDVTIPLEMSEADVTTRKNGGSEAVQTTLQKVEVEIPMVYDPDDTDILALKKAYLTRATIALAVLDGDKATVDTQGLWADFAVTKMGAPQEIEGVVMQNFTVKFGWTAVAPEWVKVTA